MAAAGRITMQSCVQLWKPNLPTICCIGMSFATRLSTPSKGWILGAAHAKATFTYSSESGGDLMSKFPITFMYDRAFRRRILDSVGKRRARVCCNNVGQDFLSPSAIGWG